MVSLRLGPADFVEALRCASTVVEEHRAALDRLDLGDDWDPDDQVAKRTGAGTALCEAIAGAVADLASARPSFSDASDAFERAARGATVARTDLGLLLDGLAEAIRNADTLDAQRFAIALEVAAEHLAVSRNAASSGRLPRVVAAAADAALGSVDDGADLSEVLIAAADDGLNELERGPVDDEFLAGRGVVDATAAGFLLVIDVFTAVVTGEPLPEPPRDVTAVVGGGSGEMRYRVRCLVQPHDGCGLESAGWLQSTWHELGSITTFDGTTEPWRVEAVSSFPGAMIEAIFDVGRPRDLHVGIETPS